MSRILYNSRVQHLAELEKDGHTLMKRLDMTPDTLAPVLSGQDAPAVNAVTGPATYGQTGVPTGNTVSRPRILARRISRLARRAAH